MSGEILPLDRERDELIAMLESPGWQVFYASVAKQWWGPGVVARLRAARHPPQGTTTPERVEEILASLDEIHYLMHWPTQRIDQLNGILGTDRA